MSDEDRKKREHSSNLSIDERELHVELVKPKQTTIDAKGNTHVIVLKKNAAWTQIMNDFNKDQKCMHHTEKQLQAVWRALKGKIFCTDNCYTAFSVQ